MHKVIVSSACCYVNVGFVRVDEKRHNETRGSSLRILWLIPTSENGLTPPLLNKPGLKALLLRLMDLVEEVKILFNAKRNKSGYILPSRKVESTGKLEYINQKYFWGQCWFSVGIYNLPFPWSNAKVTTCWKMLAWNNNSVISAEHFRKSPACQANCKWY